MAVRNIASAVRGTALPLELTLIAIFAVNLRAEQYVRPLEHANHYILLIDASGSVANPAKPEVFRPAFRNILEGDLWGGLQKVGSFGPGIPPYDARRDLLSAFHFGIVRNETELGRVNEALPKSDFLRDFMHPITAPRSRAGPEIASRLMPPTYYLYTGLSWAKQLGLWASRATDTSGVVQRTFLFIITDDEPNENTLQGDRETLERANRDKPALQIVKQIDDRYRFTNGSGEARLAWLLERKIPRSEKVLYLKVYEVTTVERLAWEARVQKLNPVQSMSWRWTQESGPNPMGELNVLLRPEFSRALGAEANAPIRLELDGRPTSAAGSEELGTRLTVPMKGELTCSEGSQLVRLSVPVTQTDSILGTREVELISESPVRTPAPAFCGIEATLRRTGIAAGVLGAVALVAAYLYFRLCVTLVSLQLPGIIYRLPVKRGKTMPGGTPISPKVGLKAFSLYLPPLLLQRVFCRGATITIESDNGSEVRLNRECALPLTIGGGKLIAFWDDIPSAPTHLTVRFRQGRLTGERILAYPRGIVGEGAKT